MEKPFAALKPKSRRLAQFRRWHTWGGLFAAVFMVVAATSGLVLNYKQPIFKSLGLEIRSPRGKDRPEGQAKPARSAFTTVTRGQATALNLDAALAAAHTEWGDVPLERVELREEHGELTFKIRQRNGLELWVNAATGESFVKGEFEMLTKPGPDGKPGRQFDWGKLLLNLHTGRIGGEAGKVVMSLAALTLLFLTASGIYMWVSPLLARRQSRPAHVQAFRLQTPVG